MLACGGPVTLRKLLWSCGKIHTESQTEYFGIQNYLQSDFIDRLLLATKSKC